MGISTISQSTDTLLNRGLASLNLRSINYRLTELFQRYTTALHAINGSDLLGAIQTKQVQDSEGLSVEYIKGQIVVRNAIDSLQFLIDNRRAVGKIIGVDSTEIYTNRRNLGAISEYLHRLGKSYDLGDQSISMQTYISKHDSNIEGLDSQMDWTDYILTQDWIDQLADAIIQETQTSEQESGLSDHRIEYLADIIHGLLKDHEAEYHSAMDEFVEGDFLDRAIFKSLPSGEDNILEPVDLESKYQDAVNSLCSFGKLNYGFYEIFKPIGNTTEKYIKVKLSTSGELDITGVVSLDDCEHVEWEYGTMEYLRSLNTGNKRYRFKLSRPFNDTDSVLWWKPDKEEPLEPDYDEDTEEGEVETPTGNRYYKPYETERFLRWFGSNYIPVIDPDTITKKTICAIPRISNDVQSDQFYADATNITERNTDLTRVNIDNTTSLSLLSLAPKSTIEIVPVIDEENPEKSGQYVEFIVSGHQQTSNLAFHITGKMFNSIQEMNHFGNTWNLLTETYRLIGKYILFLEVSNVINSDLETVWNKLNPGEKLIPDLWKWAYSALEPLQRPNVVDLLRFRQIDIESILYRINKSFQKRIDFMSQVSGIHLDDKELPVMADKISYIQQNTNIDMDEAESLIKDVEGKEYVNGPLERYIMDFPDSQANDYAYIPLSDDTKKRLISAPLKKMHNIGIDDDEKEKLAEELEKYEQNYDIEVEELRESITTFNNLIVRLPVDTHHNKVASRHIFLDWKNYVDKACAKLVENGKLFVKLGEVDRGVGTDKDDFGVQKVHEFTEYYTDVGLREPLVDYSHLYDVTKIDGAMFPYTDPDTGKPLGDRWDYWTEEDFM